MANRTSHYDVIVIGVGGMGSAASYHLAKRGYNVLGLEQFDIPHEKSSNHGVTRIIRKAYFENPAYVPLLHRAYELWEILQEENDRTLLHLHGSITAGTPEDENFTGAIQACEEHDLPYEILSSDKLTNRFPAYQLPESFKGVYQPDGGFLASDRCLIAHVEETFENGGEIHTREKVLNWDVTSSGVQVNTEHNEYTADRLIISAGPWAQELIDDLQGLATPERQVLGWLQPKQSSHFTPDNFPIFTVTVDEGPFYGFPVFETPGFKIGCHHHLKQDTTPETLDETPRPEDERHLRSVAEKYFPTGAGPTMRLSTCMYTNSPDEQFIIDTHPNYSEVVIAAGFSGHGYKFCSVVGEILADLAIQGQTEHPIDLFSFDRLE